MSGYVWKEPKPTAAEADRLEMENRKLATRIETAKKDRDRLQAVLKEVRAQVNDARTKIDRARMAAAQEIDAATTEAAAIMVTAEREAATIQERAHRQAWVLRDRAYTDGATRRLDQAKARKTVLNRR